MQPHPLAPLGQPAPRQGEVGPAGAALELTAWVGVLRAKDRKHCRRRSGMQFGAVTGQCHTRPMLTRGWTGKNKLTPPLPAGDIYTVRECIPCLPSGQAASTAWWAWLFVHIYYLLGFKNKIFVLAQWAYSYLAYRKGARLIVNKEWRFYQGSRSEGNG